MNIFAVFDLSTPDILIVTSLVFLVAAFFAVRVVLSMIRNFREGFASGKEKPNGTE